MRTTSQTAREGLFTLAAAVALMAAIHFIGYFVVALPGTPLFPMPG